MKKEADINTQSSLSLKFLLIVSALMIYRYSANADVYKWEDENGLHFTDDLSKVPASKRNISLHDVTSPPITAPSRVVRNIEQPQGKKDDEDGEGWFSRYARFTPPPGFTKSIEPGNCGISRTGLMYRKRSTDLHGAPQIILAAMDGRLTDSAIAKRVGLPQLTTNLLFEHTRSEIQGEHNKNLTVSLGSLAGRGAVVIFGKKEKTYLGKQIVIFYKRYQTLGKNTIFEASIFAMSEQELQEIDEQIKKIELIF